ncbi:hypothetical protein M569_14326 [Genlisea aurea]|uniref:TauD/TfdA-like domain-containing protein n=1 Tax=Genlisea aurea TaxID=192259 RepID=S8DLM6_9LAMI|nr:hypothetical protein M569_14326 [Genlisea aurea]
MPENSSFFAETTIPHQKTFAGVTFPAVLTPATDFHANTASAFRDAVAKEKPLLESLLHKHGAILFRGFGSVTTVEHFNDVVEAFEYEEFHYVGGAAPRRIIYGRVSNTNDAPPHEKIIFHHELSQVSRYPSKIFFFCEVPAEERGETPIVLSHLIYDGMKKKYPEFVEKLEKYGLKYHRMVQAEDNKSSPVGRGWKSTFMTDDRQAAEKIAGGLNMKLEWKDDDSVKMIMGPIPAIKYDEKRERKIWFNNIVIFYPDEVTFGDDTPLPGIAVQDCLKMMEEESVAVPWEKGDVMLVDNLAALHARNPYVPPRSVWASLCV